MSARIPERRRKKREMIDEKTMSKQPPTAPIASAVGPSHTIIQINRTPRHWKFTSTIAPPETPTECIVAYGTFFKARYFVDIDLLTCLCTLTAIPQIKLSKHASSKHTTYHSSPSELSDIPVKGVTCKH